MKTVTLSLCFLPKGLQFDSQVLDYQILLQERLGLG
jgi:hypothetical protein